MTAQMNGKDNFAGHRKRLRQRFLKGGPEALADYEILELLLSQAIPRIDVKPLAKRLLQQFGSFGAVVSQPAESLLSVKGMGEAAVVALKSVQAAALLLMRQEILKKPIIDSWKSVIDYCHAAMAHDRNEHFRLLFLDSRNVLIADEVQQRGTVDHTPVYPREVVKRALELGASAIVMVHNHPSGDPSPSKEDIVMTREIAVIGEKLGISLHDHFIISRRGHRSLKDMGLL